MKLFLSAIESGIKKDEEGDSYIAQKIVKRLGGKMKWNLTSYYYTKNRPFIANFLRDNSEELMVDSGAHSFQKGKVVNWDEYTDQYADFIRTFDRPNVIGYFEMDVDNIIGYPKVLELRKRLLKVSDKIIPVWHLNRGIKEFQRMCEEYTGKIVAISGFSNGDIKDDQYIMFLKYAKRHNCFLHGLGLTRTKILDKVPFDYVDSSSWLHDAIFGRLAGRRVSKEYSKYHQVEVKTQAYIEWMKKQERYYQKWRNTK